MATVKNQSPPSAADSAAKSIRSSPSHRYTPLQKAAIPNAISPTQAAGTCT